MSHAQADNAQPPDAITTLMSLVTERRTLIQFQIAEKSSRTFRIKASSWKAAKEMIDETHHNSGYINSDNYDDDFYHEVDGCHEFIQSYAPTLDQKIKQVKIGYEWYDLQQLIWDPHYHLESDFNINRVLMEKLELA
mgnify:CR=1 FL=1|tara:strand:- start:1834 stop:2244 length:411 start_codon:yes stop_codon:yes gene_type:complete